MERRWSFHCALGLGLSRGRQQKPQPRPASWWAVTLVVSGGSLVGLQPPVLASYVALMAGQTARPLQGQFNAVPVLHSNQPEEVTGPGILISTAPGYAYASETRQPLANATYTFQGDFGAHIHHKYFPSDRNRLGNHRDRGLLTLATILINPSTRPVHIRFTIWSRRAAIAA